MFIFLENEIININHIVHIHAFPNQLVVHQIDGSHLSYQYLSDDADTIIRACQAKRINPGKAFLLRFGNSKPAFMEPVQVN